MSVSDIERGLVAGYILRILRRGDLPLRATRHVLGWLKERGDSLNFQMPKPLNKAIGNMYSPKFRVAELERTYGEHKPAIMAMLKKAADETALPQPLTKNVKMLVKALDLPPSAARIVTLIACYTRFEQVEYLCDAATEVAGPLTRSAALLTGEDSRTIERLMSPLGDIIGTGLLQIKDHGEQLAGTTGRYAVPWRIDLCLDQNYRGFKEMRQMLLGTSLSSTLEASDYNHIATDRDLIAGVLKGAAKAKAKGVNILIYGPAGSGKTELTKMATLSAGLSLYSAGEASASTEGESNRSERLSDLVFALRLLAGARGTAILFDEMEDVAWQLIKRGGSKLYLNRILENNPVPVLWTSNHIGEVDPAVLRRMTLAIELKQPPASQRAHILRRLDQRIKVGLNDEDIEQLSRQIDATPAVLENALKAAKFSGGGRAAVERAASGIVRAISGNRTKKATSLPEFDPRLTRAKPDLNGLTDRLSEGGNLNFSLLLSGPPGTGKSAYGRYLANHLGLEVIHKRASDILGAFVGESEKRIADAFEQSREQKAMLIFDEAETFLFDRRDAVRSWEISQVNEMLTWMEDHAYPVVCTTNLMDRFDRASMRRFTFHVKYDFLGKVELPRAYEVFFGFKAVPGEGMSFQNLTPGDFAQARRQARVLGLMDKPLEVIDLLAEISKTKPGNAASIGFVH
ncbi:MAG: ATP-binding protein [Hyphomicrobiaceae bacterium]|nr:ATP-binding protein [Hyphomicrobiaceae bacterium]